MYGIDYPEPPDLDPWATEDEPSEPESTPGDTWQAVDLAETLQGLQNGTIQRLAPTVGRLSDGRALFYRGKVNGVAGASNCGKTWTALLACAQEIAAGEHAVYVDLEDDAAGVIERLLLLGVDPGDILARFHYVHPDEPYGERASIHLSDLVRRVSPSVLVIDSTGESLALDGAKPNDDDDVARWFRRLPKRLAAMGPAVVVLDHVVKADEGGLWPIGSQRKRAAIGGAQYMQTPVRPFDRDTDGWARLVVAKDRHGNYRQGMKLAELHVTPNGDAYAALTPLEDARAGTGGTFRPTSLMERISRFLEGEAEARTTNHVAKAVKGKRTAALQALDVLVHEGYVSRTARGNSHLHELRRQYRAADDPLSDTFRGREPLGAGNGAESGGTGSGSLDGEPGNQSANGSGNHPGTTWEPPANGGRGEGGRPVIHRGDDPDDRPRCEDCTRRLGASEQRAGVCLACHRVRIATEAARGGA